MSKKKSTGAISGVSTYGLLTIAFIVLKLTHQIDWSWMWVLSPLWIGFALFVLFLIIAFIIIVSGR